MIFEVHKFYSEVDPSQIFETHQEAQEYEQKLVLRREIRKVATQHSMTVAEAECYLDDALVDAIAQRVRKVIEEE